MLHAVFDTETTDLIKNSLQPLEHQPRIIEFFGLLLDDEQEFKEVESINLLINPGIDISAEVTRITHITDEMVKDKPKFSEVEPLIAAYFKKADVVVAHNVTYDMDVVNFEYKRLKKDCFWPWERICTVEATEHFKGHRLNLNALHTELFGKGFEGAHRAETDVRALARCYVELKNRGEI